MSQERYLRTLVVVASKAGSAVVDTSTFEGNSAQAGGAIFLLSVKPDAASSTFDANSSDLFGSAIFNQQVTAEVTNSTSYDCKQGFPDAQGAVFDDTGSTAIVNSTFSENAGGRPSNGSGR